MLQREVIVGTRSSALALWQTRWVVKQLKKLNPEYEFQIKELKTQGDKILDVALAKIGDKGLFTKELEMALLSEEIDFAVHSMKDLPTELPQGLIIAAVTKREQPYDVLLSPKNFTLDSLPHDAKVGTSSLRRKAQLLNYRKDLQIEDLRGNVNTRIKKMEDQNFDAIVLAYAGVERMGWSNRITQKLPFDIVLPAVGQGAIGIEIKENNQEIKKLVKTIADQNTSRCVKAERAFLRRLEGGCQIPIGALAHLTDQGLELEGVVASLDGNHLIRRKKFTRSASEETLGIELAEEILSLGGEGILADIREEMEV